MLDGPNTYLLLNIGTMFFPLVLSFDKKVAFYKNWKYLFIAIFIVGAFFIVWDVWFTKNGVWGFNPTYLLGVDLINLPLEEWLFFITIPYACVFIYECLRGWFNIKLNIRLLNVLTYGGSALLILAALFNYEKAYTAITFSLLATFLIVQRIMFKHEIEHYFYPTYGIAIFPFMLVNGVLTAKPVVMYNNEQNLGFRVTTIPFEDIWYGMLLILMNVIILEWIRKKKFVIKKITK
ncbi:MAG: lycopene cyclase domain-containing protein [Bacteroidia bacterium]